MWRRAVAATVVCVLLLAALVFRFFVHPRAQSLLPADAVVVLAGSAQTRLAEALELAEKGPGVLVVSAAGGPVNAEAQALCDTPGDLVVYCFTPTPNDTRGEARGIGRLVDEHAWTRLTIVTSSYHVTRAGLLIRRCTGADVQMAQAPSDLSTWQWAVRLTHEIGGVAEATVRRSC